MESGAHIRLIFGKAYKAIEKVDRESIAETGLNLSDFNIKEALHHKGPLPVNTIGKKVLLTSGSMTAAVNRLHKKGFVKRIQDRSDGRPAGLNRWDKCQTGENGFAGPASARVNHGH